MATVYKSEISPCGKCYFLDGTVEDIIAAVVYSDENVVFHTESGKYQFRKWWEPKEALRYYDPNPLQTMVPMHGFYKFVRPSSDEPEVAILKVPIEKIVIGNIHDNPELLKGE